MEKEDEKQLKDYLNQINKTIFELRDDFNLLFTQYSEYFADAKKQSNSLYSCLATWAELESKMSLNFSQDQKKKIEQLVAITTEVTSTATKSLTDVSQKKELVDKLIRALADFSSMMLNKFPKVKDPYGEMKKLQELNITAIKNYYQLKNELPLMLENLNKAKTLLSGVMN